MCISWCADLMTLRNARCNDKDSIAINFGIAIPLCLLMNVSVFFFMCVVKSTW